MEKHPLPLGEVYGLLEPGPVVLLTTAHEGRTNVMTQSWHTMMDFEPPLVGCIVSDRNYSFGLLMAGKECAINIPTAEMAEQVVGCGNSSGRDTDKFAVFGLTAVPAGTVAPPLIAECYANLECKVVDTRMVSKYGLFVLEVVAAWVGKPEAVWRTLHHQGHGTFVIAENSVTLPSAMP